MLTRYRPLAGTNPFTLFDSLFSDFEPFFGPTTRFAPVSSGPRFEMNKLDEGFELTADLPGVKAEDLTITAEDGVLTVKGERKLTPPEGFESRRTERGAFSFERSFKLGDRVDVASINATLTDGVLKIHFDRLPEAKPRQIAVSVS